MQINLNNEYYIEIDEFNHTLKKRYTGKTKDGVEKETEKVIGYYGNLKSAVEGFIKRNQLDSMAYTSLNMREYVKMVEEVNKEAVRAIMSVLEQGTKGEENG